MARQKRLLAFLAALLVVGVFASCGKTPEGKAPEDKAPQNTVAEGQSPQDTAPASTDKVSLRFRPREGESYKARMVTDQKISQAVQGQKQEIPQTVSFGFTYNVKEVRDDGTAVVQVSYDSVQFKQEGPMGKIEYDSASPSDSIHPMVKGFAALVGLGFSMEVTPTGKVVKVEGAGEMLSRMMESIDMPTPAARAAMEEKMKDQFGDQALKEMMEQMMAIYPDEPVAIGDSWSKRVVISKGTPMIMDNTWTLKSRGNGVAVLEVQSKVEPNPGAEAMEMGVAKVKQELRGAQSGTIELDEATGWTLRSTLNQKLSGNMVIQTGVEGAPSMTIPISIESVIRLESPQGQ